MFSVALFTIDKLWKQSRCPTTGKWIKKMWYLYTMEFYSATKKVDTCGRGEDVERECRRVNMVQML
jgi:hypothetical protein